MYLIQTIQKNTSSRKSPKTLNPNRVMKGHYLTDGFERISTKMAKEYPIFDWNMEKIRTKFDTEKRRLRAWLTWRDGFSGASFDEEGRAVGTPEQISHFLASNPKHEWLFTQGLSEPQCIINGLRDLFRTQSARLFTVKYVEILVRIL